MKLTKSFALHFTLIIAILFSALSTAAAQTDTYQYTPVHTEDELKALFSQVKNYLDTNGKTILPRLDDTQNQIITQAYIRSWSIIQYENATAEQIDNAYNALFNMSLFLGLAAEPDKSFSSGMLFEYAVQLLDQEYFDLMTASGETPDNIEYAEYLRGVAEGLVETPEEFTPEEVQDYLFEIYQETYLAAGLKTIAHTEALPLPEELFAQEESTLLPNPMIEYISAEPLNKMLKIKMPELPENFGAKMGYYSILADVVAEIEYLFPDGGKLITRLSPAAETDISGIYGAKFYENLEIAGTMVEVDKYQTTLIAKGTVRTMNGTPYSFALDAENIPKDQFHKIVTYFIEECRNQKTLQAEKE